MTVAFRGSFCLSVSACLSVCVCLSASLCQPVCLSVSLCLSMSVSVVSLCLCDAEVLYFLCSKQAQIHRITATQEFHDLKNVSPAVKKKEGTTLNEAK